MQNSTFPRYHKFSREVSNFIVNQVLERKNHLLKNSYRRLAAENVARNEHWTSIAEIVSECFDIQADSERIRTHFQNRRKMLVARMKEEMKSIPDIEKMSTKKKIQEMSSRRILCGDEDEKMAEVCLEMDEFDTIRAQLEETTSSGTENLNENMFSFLNNHDKEIAEQKELEMCKNAPMLTESLATNQLASCLSASSSSSLFQNIQDMKNRKRRATSTDQQRSSHLIVELSSRSELKRLLSILIDNGFSRFQHVDNISTSSILNSDIQEGGDSDANSFDEQNRYETFGLEPNEQNLKEKDNVEIKKEDEKYQEEEEIFRVDDEEGEEENGMEINWEEIEKKSAKNSPAPPTKMSTQIDVCCELCGSCLKLNHGRSKWNLYEHVIAKHSNFKPYKCKSCPYVSGRKVRVRQHTFSQHNSKEEPEDMITQEMKKKWLETMSKCFPRHQYEKHTIASKLQ